MWTIRRAGPADRDALAQLCRDAVGPDDYVPDFLDAFIRDGVTFVAFDWPYLAGMMVYDDTPDGSAWLHAARTLPAYRRQGVATALGRACEALGRERRRTSLRLWASVDNIASVAAVRGQGFLERARFTRMRVPAARGSPGVRLQALRPDEAWPSLEASPILRHARGYVFHGFYFLPLTRANVALLSRLGALWRFGDNGVAISEGFEDARGRDLQVQPLFGNLAAILRASPGIARSRRADRAESFLPHEPAILEAAKAAGFEPMEWGQEAILFEKPLR